MAVFSPTKADLRVDLSFQPLNEFWKSQGSRPDLVAFDPCAQKDDPRTEAFFGALFPPATFATDIAAVVSPLDYETLYATPACAQLLKKKSAQIGTKVKERHEVLLTLYRFVLGRVYHLDLGPLPTHTFELSTDGLSRFYRARLDLSWCQVDAPQAPPLTDELRLEILKAGNDPGRLEALVPLSLFSIRGFGVLRVADVTESEAVSRLKLLLVEADSVTDTDRYCQIQGLVRTVLAKADVDLSLAAYRDDRILVLRETFLAEDHCILMGSQHLNRPDFAGTVFEKALTGNRPYAFPLLEGGHRDPRLEEFHRAGVRSLVVSPLTIGDDPVGLAVLASAGALRLTAGDLDVLAEVLPLLALGVKRSVEDLDRRVQALIQKNFTAIHPAVAWKFQREATRAMVDRTESPGEIVFENVWPLYAASDIRNSSTHRSQAILADLQDQLDQGSRIVDAARTSLELPLLDELSWRLRGQKDLLDDGLNAGDEISVLNFLRRELEPTFDELEKAGPGVRALVEAYRASVHPEARSLYHRRKEFDESVRALNQAMSALVDRQQAEAQLMFPHYFDKNTTDGIDQNIYIGPSLVPDGRWDPLYLKNLKLWQFLTLAKVARLADQMKPSLPVPLEMTHLIMVQDLPITIRFRSDERRFNVDGAYNIRYEIMKKRIDKATVKGTGERLTQPMTIAVVYSQGDEAREYRQFIEWLIADGWLVPGVEELDLDDLQGIHGLKALRVGVRPAQ